MNLQTLQTELKRIERRREKLKKQFEAQKATQFTALPRRVGLKSVDALIMSLAPYASPRLKSRIGANGEAGVLAGPERGRGRRRGRGRAAGAGRGPGRPRKRGRPSRYSPDVKNAIRSALEKGEMTAVALGKKYGVSPFSIKDWKKQWGITKPRKKK